MHTHYYHLAKRPISGPLAVVAKGIVITVLVVLTALVAYMRLQEMNAPLYTTDYYPDDARLAQAQQTQRKATLNEEALIWQTYSGTARDALGNPFALSYAFYADKRMKVTVTDMSQHDKPRLELSTQYYPEGAVMRYPTRTDLPLARLIPNGGQPVRQVSEKHLEVFMFGEWQTLSVDARQG